MIERWPRKGDCVNPGARPEPACGPGPGSAPSGTFVTAVALVSGPCSSHRAERSSRLAFAASLSISGDAVCRSPREGDRSGWPFLSGCRPVPRPGYQAVCRQAALGPEIGPGFASAGQGASFGCHACGYGVVKVSQIISVKSAGPPPGRPVRHRGGTPIERPRKPHGAAPPAGR